MRRDSAVTDPAPHVVSEGRVSLGRAGSESLILRDGVKEAEPGGPALPTSRVPPYDQLLNPTLAALHRLGGSASVPELVEAVIQDQKFPPEVVEEPHTRGSRTRLEYRLAWA